MEKRAVIDLKKCRNVLDCDASKICPVKAIERYDEEWYVGVLCNGCGKCVKACRTKAIKIG